MKKSRYLLIPVALLFGMLSLQAQQNETGYFLEGNLYRHDLNPAFANAKSYVAMPGIGNITMNFKGDLGLDNFLYIKDGKTVTFLHPSVTSAEFLKDIEDCNRFSQDSRIQLLGMGFVSDRKSGRYTSFEVNMRQNLRLNLPGDLFELAKDGLQNRTYDLSDLRMRGDAFAELALGHSAQLNDKWRIGFKMKVLAGMGSFDVKFNKASIRLGKDGYVAETDGEAHVSVKGFQYLTSTESYKAFENNQQVTRTRSYIDDVDVDSPGPDGLGGALDLGAVYRMNDTWQFSASVQDLGFVLWQEDHVAYANGCVNTNDYEISLDDEDYNSLEHTVDVLIDDLARLYQFQPGEDSESCRRWLPTVARVGAEYTAPFYRKLKFGLLGTAHLAEDDTWTDVRLSANVAPVRLLSVSTAVGTGTYGSMVGGCLNFHAIGINVFAGTEYFFANSFTEDLLPTSANVSISFGVNAQF